MKKTIITTICLLFITVASYAQENSERYEYCKFRINQGFSTGAVTTDFVMKAGLLGGDFNLQSTILNIPCPRPNGFIRAGAGLLGGNP